MKIKKLIYVLVGTLVVASSCSDTELGDRTGSKFSFG